LEVCTIDEWQLSGERTLNQYGPAVRIFEKRFVICYGTLSVNDKDTQRFRFYFWYNSSHQFSLTTNFHRANNLIAERLRVAVQIANDWFIYSSGNGTSSPKFEF
jgi:hypothetical protein